MHKMGLVLTDIVFILFFFFFFTLLHLRNVKETVTSLSENQSLWNVNVRRTQDLVSFRHYFVLVCTAKAFLQYSQ